MTEDFYDLLEISPDASQDEIKEAYREKVRVYHPDLNDDDRARAQFTAVKKAYDILSDPVERQAYDRLGHEDYVAKRTSGIPSPDVWASADDDDDASDADAESDTRAATAGAATAGASTASTGSTTGSRSKTGGTAASSSGRSSAAGSGTRTQTGSTTRDGAASGTTGSTADATAGASATGTTANRAGSTASGSRGTETTHSRDAAGAGREASQADPASGATQQGEPDTSWLARAADNPLVRWWRRQNFALPLIWLSVLVYVGGLAHFALENGAALSAFRTELAAAGTDPDGLRSVLTDGRHGFETATEFVAGVELLAPPVPPSRWYAALAGVVGAAVLFVVLVRLTRREHTWRPISIDETILLAVALSVPTTLIGGPLLAGAVLMPFLFGVIVHHTRRGPGWKPSYLYVLPVLAPLCGFGAAVAGHATLPVDLLAFVVLPLAGAFGLPLRATIRKHFGR
ncbi:J domain-containing protein [Halopiger djelfimassiliensis]|uniref:J domain-containing protein n=1 Tax=Halopiger djelfimassiliensis TaxID=1293047 RepID=UPI00067799B7|nr:DnaJ domain-containing protein [Halopiger djelfimassiliensis]